MALKNLKQSEGEYARGFEWEKSELAHKKQGANPKVCKFGRACSRFSHKVMSLFMLNKYWEKVCTKKTKKKKTYIPI